MCSTADTVGVAHDGAPRAAACAITGNRPMHLQQLRERGDEAIEVALVVVGADRDPQEPVSRPLVGWHLDSILLVQTPPQRMRVAGPKFDRTHEESGLAPNPREAELRELRFGEIGESKRRGYVEGRMHFDCLRNGEVRRRIPCPLPAMPLKSASSW